MKALYKSLAIFLLVFLTGQEKPQAVDGVAAVVGENIILKSDVSQVVGMTALQRGLDITKDADLLLKLQDGVFKLINRSKSYIRNGKIGFD